MIYTLKIFDGSKKTFNKDIYVLEASYKDKETKNYIVKSTMYVDKNILKVLDFSKIKVFDNRKTVKVDKEDLPF